LLARDLACACLGWALAAALWVGASRLQRSMLSDEFGAEGLPRGLALLALAVSTLIALRALWAQRKVRGALKQPEVPQAQSQSLREHATAFGIIALGFGYVLAAPYLGYPVAAALLILATALHYGARLNATLVAVSAAGALFLWGMFARMLGISMPVGSLWGMLGG
jgi:TRAP-type C4-dicarboxylate transport system permease small subunit